MTTIGVLSDTHGYFHPKIHEFFANCNQIWHAGDIGDIKVASELGKITDLIAVHGNIDDMAICSKYPAFQTFNIEKFKVLMTHIGGKPGNYYNHARERILSGKPGIFVCGHSHICRVQFDEKYNMMYINPGAAGKFGLHQKITMLRMNISENNISDMEILELSKF